MPIDSIKALKVSRKKGSNPSDKASEPPAKRSKRVRLAVEPSQSVDKDTDARKEAPKKADLPAVEGSESTGAEGAFIDIIGEGSMTTLISKKDKGKGRPSPEIAKPLTPRIA